MLRTIVIGMAVALAGCASTQTKGFAPGDYTAGKGSGFFSTPPKAGTNKADFTLRGPTHVVLIKPVGTYSLVRLPDRSLGYVSNENLTAGVPANAKPSPTPKKKSTPKPASEPENSGPEPAKPKPTPTPEAESKPKPANTPVEPSTPPADEVPAFRY
jgi:outer membrane biosynthesis protein TonB